MLTPLGYGQTYLPVAANPIYAVEWRLEKIKQYIEVSHIRIYAKLRWFTKSSFPHQKAKAHEKTSKEMADAFSALSNQLNTFKVRFAIFASTQESDANSQLPILREQLAVLVQRVADMEVAVSKN